MELDVQPRQRPVWPWAVAALVGLALVLWWIFGRSEWGRAPVVAQSDGVVADSVGLPSAVDTFVQFVEGTRAADAMAVDHAYTATAIRNLTAALEALVPAGGADVQDELTTLRQQVSMLERDPRSTEHADYTRATFRTIAGLMNAMQEARFPDASAEVANVKAAAERLDADRPLLEQREAVQTFFDRAADAVRRMSAAA